MILEKKAIHIKNKKMENKTGNFIIISGESMAFTSENIFFNSFSNIETQAAEKIIKQGELNGRRFGDYTDLLQERSDIKIKDTVSFNFYHTWSPNQKDTKHIGSDSIIVNETRIIRVFKDGEELKTSKERFVTDYFAHVDDNSKFDGFALSTWYYNDSTDLRVLLKESNYKPMKEVVRKYAEGVAKYKKEHRDGSPVQAQAEQNREDNKGTSSTLTATTILGSIISQIPHLYAKYGGKVIAGISKGLKVVMIKPEHADEVAIMFKLEYEK